MKEIIKHINGVAGRVVTVTGLTEQTMTRDNVLGILNGTQNEVLYVPMFYGDLQSVTYSAGTLTITLADTVPAINNGDKLFVKLYADVEMATENTANATKTAVGIAPIGSERTTVFQYLAAILDNIEGQGGEDIPEGLGDRINLLLQFFGLPQALPEYHAMTTAEVLEIADEEWLAMYGFVAVPNTVHTVDASESEREFTTYMNPNKTYADYGWQALWDAQGETIALTDHPTAGRVIYTFNPINE